MGNDQSANVNASVVAPVTEKSYQQRALFSFVPSTVAFMNAFLALQASDDVFIDADTMEPLVLRLTPSTWQGKLKALAALPSEPVWHAANAYFNPSAEPASNGVASPVTISDELYIGRRTSAVPTVKLLTYTTNDEGSTTYWVMPAKYIFGNNPAPNKGALAIFTIAADGVLTTTQLALAFQTAFNLAVPATIASAAPGANPGESEVTSAAAGYPIVILVKSSNPGPTVTQEDTTVNVANAYSTDLQEMVNAAELAGEANPLAESVRRFYWITDLQANDVVNAEGFAFVDAQAMLSPIRDYQFKGWSTDPENFDPLASSSPAQDAQAANGGDGWHRGVVYMHPRWEFAVAALLGRCVGYEPGGIQFSGRRLNNPGVPDAQIQPINYGDNEALANERKFDFYSSDGTDGMSKWGYLADGSYTDRKWTEDWLRRICTIELMRFQQVKEIVTYTDDDIVAGAGVIQATVATCLAVDPDTIVVTFKRRREVSANNIANRIYIDYFLVCGGRGIINQIGTPQNPVQITVIENLQ